MKKVSTLLRLAVFSLLCFGGLAVLNHGAANPPVPEAQIQPLPAQPFPVSANEIQVQPNFGGKFKGPVPDAGAPVAIAKRTNLGGNGRVRSAVYPGWTTRCPSVWR